jgi:hypothetical protein
MILVCKFEDPTNWDIATRGGPTTVGGGAFVTGLEAFYLLTPDLKPINGVCLFQNQLIFSTDKGRIWSLTGSSAATFQVLDFSDTSPAIGTETVISMGSDVILPRQGNAITLLYATQAYGNVLQANVAHWIPTTLAAVTTYNQIVYDITNQRVLFFVNGKVLVLYKDILAQDRGALVAGPSPWSVYTTQDSAAFNTLAAKYMLRPGTSTYSVFFGDSAGRIFDLYGTGRPATLASSSNTVQASRRSRHVGVEILNPWPYMEENLTGTRRLSPERGSRSHRYLGLGRRVQHDAQRRAAAGDRRPMTHRRISAGRSITAARRITTRAPLPSAASRPSTSIRAARGRAST